MSIPDLPGTSIVIRLVSLMGHGSKQMIYGVCGKYVEGLEKYPGKILVYYGRDFAGLPE